MPLSPQMVGLRFQAAARSAGVEPVTGPLGPCRAGVGADEAGAFDDRREAPLGWQPKADPPWSVHRLAAVGVRLVGLVGGVVFPRCAPHPPPQVYTPAAVSNFTQ